VKCERECKLEMSQEEYKNHNCLSKLSVMVINQQSIIEKQEKLINYLINRNLWISPNGLKINKQ
jgi:uncharacterized coiled-coil protein SlyX